MAKWDACAGEQIKALLLNEEANPEGHLLSNEAVGLVSITGDTPTYLDTAATVRLPPPVPHLFLPPPTYSVRLISPRLAMLPPEARFTAFFCTLGSPLFVCLSHISACS